MIRFLRTLAALPYLALWWLLAPETRPEAGTALRVLWED